MKKLLIILLIAPVFAAAQYDCENFPTISISYVIPKTIAVGVDYFTEVGFMAGTGAAYTHPKKFEIKRGANISDSAGNSFDLFAYVGCRITRIEYTVSIFINAGFIMGNEYQAKPFTSLKLLFPMNNKAISIEPGYIIDRGFTSKISIHLKL